MNPRELLLVVLIAAVSYAAGTGVAQACGCADATSVTMGWPDGGPGAKATFGADGTPGVKQSGCWAHASPTCNEIDLAWSNQAIAGVTTTWPDGSGVDATFKLQNLPSLNSNFGSHWVKASVDAKYAYGYYKLYFMEEGTDHPGGGTPNWYYYWEQTSAKYGTHTYNAAYGTGQTPFVGGSWVSYIGRDANEYGVAGTWSNAEGIDFYANLCRHEEQHRLDMMDLWGPTTNRDPENDPDADWLPTYNGACWESDFEYSFYDVNYDPDYPLTTGISDHFQYGDNFNDGEDYCMHRQAAWTNGSADASDWANPGHQY